MISFLAFVLLGSASASIHEHPRVQASTCSSTGTFTYTYGGHPAETDQIDINEDHHDVTRAAVAPFTTTVTGCPWETQDVDDDGDNDDGFDFMDMDGMDDLDHMFSPGIFTVTRTDGTAATYTTTMEVEEASNGAQWTSTVVQTIVVVTGAGGNGAAATGTGGNGNAAARPGDLAGFKAVAGGLGVALLVLAAM